MESSDKPQHFIRAKIAADVASGRFGRPVKTRFPPEPNGYLHIGHAKSICLNFGVAAEFGGTCNLRFDDTNPTTEDMEYVEAIQRDLAWLGFEPAEVRFASDYFEQYYQHAVHLVKAGKAYVCDLSLEEIRATRGTVTEPGVPSPYRNRSVEENLDLLARMRAGEFPDGAKTLRAKIDMASPNMKMRDPPLYRIRHARHYRTGDAWCIYPMYDFAHCLGDAIEGITHSLCTLEFENNRELYDWILQNTEWDRPPPEQTEFARLNLSYTVMSKRKLLKLVHEGYVSGWDDPRMPTLSGLRRRGIPPSAIRAFADEIGVAKVNSTIDIARFEAILRDDLNHKAPRVMAVVDPLLLIVESWPEGVVEELPADYWPHDVPKEGARPVPFTRKLYVERADFAEVPPKGWRRLSPGREVRLRYGYVVRCTGVEKDADGKVVAVRCTHDPATRGGNVPDGRKVRGTIHWVSAEHGVTAEFRLYDRLFSVERPGLERDFIEDLNPDSLRVLRGVVEPSVAAELRADPRNEAERRYQFERLGYFWPDPVDSRPDALVFNRIVALKDSWSRRTTEPCTRVARRAKPKARPSVPTLAPEQAARVDALVARYGISRADAVVLTGDSALQSLFEAAVAEHPNARAVANLVVNELRAEVKDRPLDALPLGGAELGRLVALVDAETISSTAARRVLAELVARGGDPQEIVEKLGLVQLSDPDALAQTVDEVLRRYPEEVGRYRAGNRNLLGFFIGQVMRASEGKANPRLTRTLLRERLG